MALLSLAREEDCDHWAHHPNAMDGHSIHASDDRFGLTIGTMMVLYPTGSFWECRWPASRLFTE